MLTCESSPSALDSPFMQKPLPTLDAAFSLFGFLPEDADERWEFLRRYSEIKAQTNFRPMNFDNAWGATYLSAEASYRSGYVTTLNAENQLQLDRALDNLMSMNDIPERFTDVAKEFDDFDVRYALTDRLTTDPTAPKITVTPCPEALHQVRLFEAGKYLARVGFNVHAEADSQVLSIVNVQGTPGGVAKNRDFESTHGISPFNVVVRTAIAIAKSRKPNIEVRGMLNPLRGNTQLYWGVFSAEDVPMFHAVRKSE